MAFYRSSMDEPADRPPLFPPAVSAFLRRRLTESVGGAMVMAAVLLLAAVLTYTPSDPSANTAGGNIIVHNALGSSGSLLADFLVQHLGLAAFLPAFMLAGWGLRFILKRPPSLLYVRVLCTVPGILFMTGALAGLKLSGTWPYAVMPGGIVGVLFLDLLNGFMPGAWREFGAIWPPALCGIIGVVTLVGALGFSYGEWGEGARRLLQTVIRTVAVALASSLWLVDKLRRSETKSASRRPLLTERADEVEEDDEPEAAELPLEDERTPSPRRSLSKLGRSRKSRAVETSAGRYEFPPLDLLAVPGDRTTRVSAEQLEATAAELVSVLNDFGVEGQILKGSPGPVVTLYELEPAPGTKSARVIGLADDIARQMSAISVRVATVPGRNVLGIELPNQKRETVFLREILAHNVYTKTTAKLPLALGKDISGDPIVADLAKMPHLLVAGTTGSGKSVSVNTMILSLLYRFTPEQVKMIMIDPKMLELSIYEGIPHLLAPVVTEPKKAVLALKWAVREMEDRYRAMSKLSVRNIDGYNERLREARAKGEVLTRRIQTGFDADTGKPVFEEQPIDLSAMPYIVVIVDEMADLMLVAGKDIEAAIQRLAQMARAAGIHIIMATQRPSVDVITGTIKANFPTRISFQVTSKIDSRTILNEQGAEQLLGQGDMLYMAGGGRVTRVHGAFASDHEVEAVVRHLKAQGEPSYLETVTQDEEGGDGGFGGSTSGGGEGDEMYDRAVQIVLKDRKISTSYLQRCLRIGYNSAARLVDRMESEGLVSPANHVGKREILVPGESAR